MGVTNLLWMGQLGNKTGSSPSAHGGGERIFLKNAKLGKIKSKNWALLLWSKFNVLSEAFKNKYLKSFSRITVLSFWSVWIFCFDGWVWVGIQMMARDVPFPLATPAPGHRSNMCLFILAFHLWIKYISPCVSLKRTENPHTRIFKLKKKKNLKHS